MSMKAMFPECDHKIFKIENIISPRTVQVSDDTRGFEDHYQGVRLLTVGRVCYDKGLDLAIETCKILNIKGYDFRWYWVGPYDAENEWIVKIKQENLENTLILLGATDNPYGYMRQADMLIHPSRFEGKSVTVEEAKVLNLPIVATNYSTVCDQIEDGKTGIIVGMKPSEIAAGISELIEHPEIREEIKNHMMKYCTGNEEQVNVLYELIEN